MSKNKSTFCRILLFILVGVIAFGCTSFSEKDRSLSSREELREGSFFFLDRYQNQFAKITSLSEGEVTFEVMNGGKNAADTDSFITGKSYTFSGKHFRNLGSSTLFSADGPLAPNQFFLKYQEVYLSPFPEVYDQGIDFGSTNKTAITDPILNRNMEGTVSVSSAREASPHVEIERVVSLVPEKNGVLIGDTFEYQGRTHLVEAIMNNGAMDVLNQRGKSQRRSFTQVSLKLKMEELKLKWRNQQRVVRRL
jgi:hypothetical protein